MNDKPNQYGPISLLLLVVIVAVVVYLAQVAPPSTDTAQAETPVSYTHLTLPTKCWG